MRVDQPHMKTEEIRETGILHEINRQMLHPLGLAAEVDPSTGTLRILDCRDDVAGVIYANELLGLGKVARFRALQAERHPRRLAELGFVVQPEADAESPADTQCAQCGCSLNPDGKCSAQPWHFSSVGKGKGKEITEMPGQEFLPSEAELEHESMMGLHIIVTGNPVDGFEFYGPFNNGVEAAEAGNTDPHLADGWWTAPLLAWAE